MADAESKARRMNRAPWSKLAPRLKHIADVSQEIDIEMIGKLHALRREKGGTEHAKI
jgi:hypothetical protein